MTGEPVSNSASTGGAGTFFEQHVGAYWLAQLLVQGIPPILIDTAIQEVHFQTEHLGWRTDDFLIVCQRRGGGSAKLACQVKRGVTVSEIDDEFKKSVHDSWADFKNSTLFSQVDDRLVLVVLRGTDTLLRHFVGLLDAARAAPDAKEFERRLTVEGFVSVKAHKYCAVVQTIIGDVEGSPVTPSDIWSFLRLVHVLNLDLDSSTRQTEAHIKNLLAHTNTESDVVESAAYTWSELLSVASTAMEQARSLRRTDLPAELLRRHGVITGNDYRAIRALSEHADLILRGIRSTIGHQVHLKRVSVVQRVLAELQSTQVVLISGPAGSGKSVIAKDAVSVLSLDHFAFAFRVEEFAQPHLDATLHAGQIPANGAALGAILASQDRKLILVESVERLLERTTREAFSDLMTLAGSDGGCRIVLTCRDYSVDQIRASFLQPHRIPHAIVNVPPLEDAELDDIEAALPALRHPLKTPSLRKLLSNPYFLDKATSISWVADRPAPESEREFRGLFWREIVRAENRLSAGMARRREEVFQEIAVRRARALLPYVPTNDLEQDVIAELRRDSLLESLAGNLLLVATAHDVLEDWAILHWIEEQHLGGEASLSEVSTAIGVHPAVRRSYRKWISELVEREPEMADRLFSDSLSDPYVTAQFRDDTLVALLKAPTSEGFLVRHEAQLVASENLLLKRLIHLLRVACVTTPAWLSLTGDQGSLFNVPEGSAWRSILGLVNRNFELFVSKDYLLLLGLLEDAVKAVAWWAPDLDSAVDVAGIGYRLLGGFDRYDVREARKRLLKVLTKLPKADAGRFELCLRGNVSTNGGRDRISEDLRDIVFSGMDGGQVARVLPDLLVSTAKEYLLLNDQDLERTHRFASSIDLGVYFGIKDEHRHEAFPASAIRGPWLPLLKSHPTHGIDLLVSVFNHSIEWYAHPRVHDPLEPAWEVEVKFAEGTVRKQLGNPRLWGLYRGLTVGPYVLQTLLMALERWLLELGAQQPELLDSVLLGILHRSDSAAVTGVVASAAIAHPNAAGETLLALLSVPDYIHFDRGRMVGEASVSTMSGAFSQMIPANRIYDDERKEANKLPHRASDLEGAILRMQFGPLAERAQALLDRHLAALPPEQEQTKADLIWRLAIHRMDLRQYELSKATVQEDKLQEDDGVTATKQVILLQPNTPAPRVQALVEEGAQRSKEMNARLGVMLWALRAFKRDEGDYSQWREKLAEAKGIDRRVEAPDGSQNGPGIAAAVCARDHWDEMSEDERGWCVEAITSEVLDGAVQWNQTYRLQRFAMAADRPCATVMSVLLGKSLQGKNGDRVRSAFVAALTHPNEEVRWYAVAGIDRRFWEMNYKLALRCVDAIALEASLIQEAWRVEEGRRYDLRRGLDDIAKEASDEIRHRFWSEEGIPAGIHSNTSLSGPFSGQAALRILSVFSHVPDDSIAVAAFERASRTLVGWWDADGDGRRGFHVEAAMSERLRQFAMKARAGNALTVVAPILAAVDDHPREVHSFVEGLTVIEDSRPNTAHYWYLWGLFAQRIKQATWLSHLNDRSPTGTELLLAIFLGSWWKENVRHWKSLEGYAHHVSDLFIALPPSPTVYNCYLRFLYHIGEQSLPKAFTLLSNVLSGADAGAMLGGKDTIFMLESLLQRHVYGRPLELKRDSAVRQAVLHLLDALVESGSSAAYRMRDDFVTPVT